jgi:cytochrome c oxidase subunit 2
VVHAVGQQFNWNFHLPGPDGQFGRRDVGLVTNSNPLGLDSADAAAKDDIVVLGELHVPVDRPVIIELSSKDVIHNFALPHMRSAQDAIPGQIIPMWFKPIKTGSYEVVCGQLCGLGHYSMKGMLVVDEPAEYQAWLKERVELSGSQSAPPPAERPPGEPPVGPTPGTVAPPGGPKTANPSGAPDAKPGEPPAAPNPSPSAHEHH